MKPKLSFLVPSLLFFLVILNSLNTSALVQKQDSIYLPKVSINSLNGFGPYIIGSMRDNEFIVYDLPEHTSKVVMKFIDINDKQIGKSYTSEGTNIQDVIWKVASDTMDFPLSPSLCVEVQYQSDSLAVYTIPYTVYPDTVNFFASAGWGPFITNNYTFTDTSWHEVPEVYNTFSVSNLPPRTDTVKFVIISADSTVIDSSYTVAKKGEFLDSASFENIRMDLLPLSAKYLEAYMICNGGPKEGVIFHKELIINPQVPKLISKVDGMILQDSLGTFYQNQISGQALFVDSIKYATISNGPGRRMSEEPHNYKGPYSLDIMSGDYTIEVWLKLDINNFLNNSGEMFIMAVDSVWALSVRCDPQSNWPFFSLSSLAGGEVRELFWISFGDNIFNNTDWHHLAFTGSSNSQDFFYLDGKLLGSYADEVAFNHILDSIDYKASWKTKPLYLGGCNSQINQPVSRSFITAMDEVRIWDRRLTTQEIQSNLNKKILQDTSLVGYWDFNDLRNRLSYISDLSFYNNTGRFKNAAFIPQYPDIYKTTDTITIVSSNMNTDSIKISFIDKNTSILQSYVANTQNGLSRFSVDVSAFPYSLANLEVSEYYFGCEEDGYSTDYDINELAPYPIATPVYNWNTYYYSPNDFGRLYNRIIVSGLPEGTSKVELGFEKDNQFYDTKIYTENSVPYRYSLSLNGQNNYIETSENLTAPNQFVVSLWFKTTTGNGGKLIGFSDSQNGVTINKADREIILETDGSLRFYLKGVDTTYILTAANKYNDGEWHYVEAGYYGDGIHDASLSVDGAKVDHKYYANAESYSGYWVIGRNSNTNSGKNKSIAEYFEGLLCEINIETNTNPQAELHYKLDEAKGTTIHDSGNNNDGTLKGGSRRWNHFNSLSFVAWEDNMVNKLPGNYNFYAKVYYIGGPDTGVIYPLGKYIIKDPFPENYFAYNLYLGLGPFNESTTLYNTFGFETDYDQSNQTDWEDNFVKYAFVSPEHQIIDHNLYSFPSGGYEGSLVIDMGEAPPGSFLSIEQGYHTTNNAEHITGTLSIPIYINPMLEPSVTFNPGPFDQAIVPGTMEQENTVVITTEILSDLNKVLGKFYDEKGIELASVEAEQKNDTTWHLTYNMAALHPPLALLNIEYYLGQAEYLALTEGPYKININKTRPVWFDFLPDTAFYDIKEFSDSVNFSVSTTFEDNYLINNSEIVKIPKWVPLIGETECSMKSPTVRAYLNYNIPDYKLELDQPPKFFQKVFNLGAGTAETFRLGFNYSQDNSYEIDSLNNLLATQNFAIGGSITSSFSKLENIAKKVKELIEAVKVADPETIIVSPSFGLSFSGGFEYASRSRMMIDPISGKWGSIGNLDVDADTAHHNAYKNSASYRFYSCSLGGEFSIGLELLDGLASANFGFDGRFLLGFGHSFITIPKNKSKHLKSFAFQFYERFYITALWGWYEKNVWGPKLKYNKTIWGDDMTSAFPPMKKKLIEIESSDEFSITDSITKIKPVSWYYKIPLANPQQTINLNDNNRIFIWIEPDKSYGGRKLCARHFNSEKGIFNETFTITTNRNAIHSPTIDMIDDNNVICAWAQTRHTPETILEEKSEDIPSSFVQAQDIWFGVYDIKNDSLIEMDFIDDDILEFHSGRAEANPKLSVLSDTRVLITWQVADLDTHQADIWYAFIEKENGKWKSSNPTILAEVDGVETEIKIASPEENVAVVVWKNTQNTDEGFNRLFTSTFTGSYWTIPEEIAYSGNGDYHNYFDLDFENEMGALVFTDYIVDTVNGNFERLSFLPWNPFKKEWSEMPPSELLVDQNNHLQLPRITINKNGITAISYKVESFGSSIETVRISQVDLMLGNLSNPTVSWKHIAASELVCDTTKQVRELDISFAGNDTLVILSHEFIMTAADMPYTPANGVRFGDPYMNMVLRSISFDEEANVFDVDENTFFENGNDTIIYHSDVVLGQNYPNPCNTSATVQIYLPVKTNVLLEIFDINGLRVATAIDQELGPGHFEVKLKVETLRQGTYIYRLTTDNSIKSMKMVVGK